jgi:hypothetical protein
MRLSSIEELSLATLFSINSDKGKWGNRVKWDEASGYLPARLADAGRVLQRDSAAACHRLVFTNHFRYCANVHSE